MNLEDEISKCLINLSNSVKALSIATRELNSAADKLAIVKQKPELKIVKNDEINSESIAEALTKEICEDKRLTEK